jgi:hypothetical protein
VAISLSSSALLLSFRGWMGRLSAAFSETFNRLCEPLKLFANTIQSKKYRFQSRTYFGLFYIFTTIYAALSSLKASGKVADDSFAL